MPKPTDERIETCRRPAKAKADHGAARPMIQGSMVAVCCAAEGFEVAPRATSEAAGGTAQQMFAPPGERAAAEVPSTFMRNGQAAGESD
ncbi:hypothetical protein Pstu01_31760 [Stutzerimonas stutzeri]|nr:hypothetical protein Pstu01_31760 [Stutzerimonas stutzeri]